MAKPTPALFFGHGNPLNALAKNEWTEGWAAIGRAIPRPRAITVRLSTLVSSGDVGYCDAESANDS